MHNFFLKRYIHFIEIFYRLYLSVINPSDFNRALRVLYRENLFSHHYRLQVAQHDEPSELAHAFGILNRAHILNRVDNVILFNHASPREFAIALYVLKQGEILTQAHHRLLLSHPDPRSLAQALHILNQAQIFSHENISAISIHPAPVSASRSLTILKQAKILTASNKHLVIQHTSPRLLAIMLARLNDAGLLDQAHFEVLFLPQNILLFHLEIHNTLWDRLPNHLLREHWATILQHLQGPNALRTTLTFIHRHLGIEQDTLDIAHQLNHAQSTHGASVHQSVSGCALNLLRRYDLDVKRQGLASLLSTIEQEVMAQAPTMAAKTAFLRLSNLESPYVDRGSNISTPLVLALCWLAILDDTKRQGSLAHAKALYFQGLHETQREYNLDAHGNDVGGLDHSACAAGSFNKMIEKLWGIHEDVNIQILNPSMASLKLVPIVIQTLIIAVSRKASPLTLFEYHAFLHLLEHLKTEGIECLWAEIYFEVKQTMFDEFGALYGNINHPNFLGLIEAGRDVEIKSLPFYQSQVLKSEGYRDYLNLVLRSNHRLFCTHFCETKPPGHKPNPMTKPTENCSPQASLQHRGLHQ